MSNDAFVHRPRNYCWLLVLFCLSSETPGAASFNYIYIEASEGNSSGGHVAVQFQDDVFHYQYHEEGLIRLVKQNADEFEFHYRFAGNRGLHIKQIQTSEEINQTLEDYFKLQFQIQNQQYAILDDLRRDLHLLKSMQSPLQGWAFNELELNGAGLFYSNNDFVETADDVIRAKAPETHSATIVNLRQSLDEYYGRDFLDARVRQLTAQIRQLKPHHATDSPPRLTSGRFPERRYSFARQYQDLLTNLLALNVLKQARPLTVGLIKAGDVNIPSLSKAEIEALTKLRSRLHDSLLRLLDSERPDWGYAVLVNCARLIALDSSIEKGQFFVIDTLSGADGAHTELNSPEYRDIILRHLSDTLSNLLKIRQKQNYTEIDYSLLERQMNRYHELHQAIHRNRPIRIENAQLAPSVPLALPPIQLPELTNAQIETNLKQLMTKQRSYRRQLRQLYTYHLINRNCVTELFYSLNQALLPGKQTDRHTGKIPLSRQLPSLNMAEQPFNFIPLFSSYVVAGHYPVAEEYDLPSFRQLQLVGLYRDHDDPLVYLQENNTLSASTYRPNPDDSFFIFFTEDEFALRPLYGVVNTLAALGQSLLGLLSWPLDNGQHLQTGLRGMMMSLPELAFVNLRKGSYKYLPYSYLQTADSRLAYSHGTVRK